MSKHHIQPEYGDEQADGGRDCRTRLARPNSQARTGTGTTNTTFLKTCNIFVEKIKRKMSSQIHFLTYYLEKETQRHYSQADPSHLSGFWAFFYYPGDTVE